MLCDTTVAIVGTPYTGDCEAGCDFTFALTTKITSELGTKCDYDRFSPDYTYLPTASDPYTYLGFASTTSGGASNVLFLGTSSSTGGTVDWQLMAGGRDRGYADYSAPLLAWAVDYIIYGHYYYSPATSYCGPYSWTGFGKAYGGAYYADETVSLISRGYDLWSFTAVDYYTEISVDTTDALTAFDPYMTVMDELTCILGRADDAFDCTYPPPAYSCPSVNLATTKGTSYLILVQPLSSAYDIVGDYRLSLDTIADPKLTLVSDDVPVTNDQYFGVTGWANVPKGP
jgi:hypothetical protein